MPEANRIDTLELQIQSDANKAEKALDGLATTLKNVKTTMGGFKTTEFSQVTNDALKMTKAFAGAFSSLQRFTKEISKSKTVKVGFDAEAIEKSIDKLRGQFKDVGKDFQFTGNSDELEKAISAATSQLDKLFAKEDRLKSIGANIETSGFKGLEYDISLLTNKLDILRDKREELQKAFAKSFENLPIQQMEYDTGSLEEKKPHISNVSPESLNFNSEAMKAVFGEMAGNIKNWNDAVSQLGGNASRILNDMQQDFQNVGGSASGLSDKVAAAGEKIKDNLKSAGLSAEQFDEYLENIQIPEIRETNLKKLQSELDRTEAKLDELVAKADNFELKGIARDAPQFRNLQEQIASLSKTADALKAKMRSIADGAPKVSGWQKLSGTLLSMSKSLNTAKVSGKGTLGIIDRLKKGFLNFAKSIGKIIPGIGKMNKSLGNLKKTSGGGFNLGKMFQMSAIYSAISAVISGIKNAVAEGSQNLAQYSSGYNQSISSMMSALTKLKNAFAVAFAPVINFVAPTITYFINLLSSAMNKVGQFFSALTGKSFTPQAVSVTQDYAAGLQDTSKGMDNTTNSAKKLKKALSVLSFDQLNQLTAHDDDSETGTGGTGGASGGELSPADMFTTTPIAQEIQDFADKVKSTLGQIFKPFQDAWNKEGKNTIDAAKGAFESLRSLAGSVGKSLLEVWTNGTGTQTLTNMLQIAQNLFNIVGNLAGQFEKAWNKAGLGTSIIQNIFNLGNSVLGTIKNITGATADWAKTLDFTPLFSSINSLLQALQPLTDNIGAGLEWFWSNVLLPIGSWTLQDAVPTFLDMLSSGIGAVNSVVEALQPLGAWLWDEFLQPLGQWTGEVVIGAMETVNGLLTEFGDWVSEHQGIVQGFVTVISSFAAAWGLASGAVTIWNGIATIASGITSALGAAIGFLTSPIGIAIAAIGGIIAAGVLLYQNWGKIKEYAGKLADWIGEKWDWIKTKTSEIWGNVSEFISTTWSNLTSWAKEKFTAIKTTVSTIWDNMKTNASTIWTNIKTSVSGVWTNLKTSASTIFTSIQTTVGGIWDKMKEKTSTVWGNIKDSITGFAGDIWESVTTKFGEIYGKVAGVFENIVNAIKSPINSAIGIANKAISMVNRALGGLESAMSFGPWDIPTPFGTKTIGFSVTFPRINDIPYLANGGLITAPTLAVMGEAFKQEAVLPLENQRAMSKIADSILSNASGMGMDEEVLTNAVARGVAMAMMNNMQGQSTPEYIQNSIYLDSDVMARAITKAQKKNDYRFNPTPQFGY